MSANPGDRGIAVQVRQLLGTVLELEPERAQTLADETPLFGGGLSLDSLTGLELLAGIETIFGVDIASEDLNLDSLESIGTLVSYLRKASGQAL